ncbi:hypothetical protein AgCh_030746 [Apium graveolens]
MPIVAENKTVAENENEGPKKSAEPFKEQISVSRERIIFPGRSKINHCAVAQGTQLSNVKGKQKATKTKEKATEEESQSEDEAEYRPHWMDVEINPNFKEKLIGLGYGKLFMPNPGFAPNFSSLHLRLVSLLALQFFLQGVKSFHLEKLSYYSSG